jgi:flagellar motility protein MotE (MotC chaperone)
MAEKLKSFFFLLFIFAGVFVLTVKIAEIIESANKPTSTPSTATCVSDKTPSEIALLESLSLRRQQLEAKEAEIAATLKAVKDAERQLDTKILTLRELEKSVKEAMKVKESKDAAKIASLVKIYSGMRAREAAKLMVDLDTETAAKIIGNMREIKAAALLSELPEDKAKAITEEITSLELKP